MTTITLTPEQVAQVVAASRPAAIYTQADYVNNFNEAAAKYGWKYQWVAGVPTVNLVPEEVTTEAVNYDRIKQDMKNKGVDLSFEDYMLGNFEHYGPDDVKPHDKIYLGYGKKRDAMPTPPALN